LQQVKKRRKIPEINRLVIASNRLPVVLAQAGSGRWEVQSGSGGLVTALTPVLQQMGGLWIGWPGTQRAVHSNELIEATSKKLGYTLCPVSLTQKEINGYYFGFSNEVLWPLFHDLQTRCNFDPAYWSAYQTVNSKFAKVIAKNIDSNDYIWIHDYHLMLVGKNLRSMGIKNKLGFFLHIPFPPLDIWLKLPWRAQMLEAFLEYDLIGFQTPRDRKNFVHCIDAMFKGPHIDTRKQVSTMVLTNREMNVGSFPISIDFKDFAKRAASSIVAEKARRLREAIPNCQIILGLDRLDYSKGIPEKLRAYQNALYRFPDLRGKVVLIQVVVPSREDIAEYQALRAEIEGLVSEINGVFTQPGWIPVQYMYRSLDRDELLGYYRVADIALITSLKDGMNLVAKEYCTCDIDKHGVLILSEFTGAATQMHKNSILVNPYDIEGVADAIHKAYHMGADERRMRMQRLRQSVAKRDIFWWVDSFLKATIAEGISHP
jgi:trehalose 6-phosphate synthase